MRSRGNLRSVLLVLALAAAGAVVPLTSADAAEPVMCHGQEATIVGTDDADDLMGTEGDDVIAALGGADVVHALDGDDVVCGGSGSDELYGEGDDDHLYAGSLPGGVGAHPASLTGGDGDDVLRSGPDYVYVDAGAGSDDVVARGRDGDRGLSAILPGSGDDRVVLRGADARRLYEVDYDSSPTGIDVDLARGVAEGDGIGHDTLVGVRKITGSRFADVILGTSGDDHIVPEGGRDLVRARRGATTSSGPSSPRTCASSAALAPTASGRATVTTTCAGGWATTGSAPTGPTTPATTASAAVRGTTGCVAATAGTAPGAARAATGATSSSPSPGAKAADPAAVRRRTPAGTAAG